MRLPLRYGRFLLAIPLTLAAEPPGPDAPHTLEDLLATPVVAATKSRVRLREAPASVSILTREDIRRYGWRTLAEALGSLAGFHVYSDRIYDFVISRGFALPNDPNSRMLLLVDGHSIVEAFGGYNGHLPIPDLAMVERIEVVRGPNSVAFGTNALFSVVNVVTQPDAPAHGVRGLLEGGSFQHARAAASYSGPAGAEGGFQIHGSLLQSGDQSLYLPAYDNADYGTGGRSSGRANLERVSTAGFHLKTGHWTAQGLARDRRKQVPTGLYGGEFNTDQTFFRDTNAFLDVAYKGWLLDEVAFQTRAYLDAYRFEGRYVYRPDPTYVLGPPYPSEFNQVENTSYGAEALGEQSWSAAHRTVFGAEVRQVATLHFRYQSEQDPAKLLDQSIDRDNAELIWSVFASHRYTPGPWDIQAGLHFDHYLSVGGNLSLRGSLGLQVGKGSWLKLLYGEAFRAPNQWELEGGFFLQGNRSLQPETVRTWELLLDANLTPTLNLRQTLFRNEDRSTIQPVGGTQFSNTEGLLGTGLETEVRYLDGATSAFASVSYSDTRWQEGQDPVAFSPHWLVKGGISRPFMGDRFTLALEARAVGPRPKASPSEGDLPSYVLVNLSLAHLKITQGLELDASVRNLFDARYDHPSFQGDLASYYLNTLHPVWSIPADGRSFTLTATFRF